MEAGSKREIPLWAIWVACLLPFLGFWAYGLFDLDEGFYGAVVVDMIRRGDWITPTLNGVPWFEKPILAYWLAIPSVQVFGEAIGPRLPSILCTLATIFVLFKFSKQHLGERIARLVALIYATNLLVVGIGRMMMTDAPLVLCLTLALTTLANWRLSGDEGSGWKPWTIIGLCVGFGVLAKGPVALVLFGGVFIFSTILIPSFKSAWKSAWPVGLLVCLAVMATWYVPCYLQNGQTFVQDFLIEQNIGRFSGGDKAHAVPWYAHPVYFPAILLVSFLPWVCFGLRNLLKPWNGTLAEKSDFRKFVLIWGLVPLAFFTISGTKLPHYILPSVGPLAVIGAVALLTAGPLRSWDKLGLAWCAFVLVLAQTIFTLDWNNRMREVQELGKLARHQGLPFFMVQIGRQGPSSTGTLALDETSHPSVLFYFGFRNAKTAIETDDLEGIAICPMPSLVLTRRDRITAENVAWFDQHRLLIQKVAPENAKGYELWSISRHGKPVPRFR